MHCVDLAPDDRISRNVRAGDDRPAGRHDAVETSRGDGDDAHRFLEHRIEVGEPVDTSVSLGAELRLERTVSLIKTSPFYFQLGRQLTITAMARA